MLMHYIKIKPIQHTFAVSEAPCLSRLEPVINLRHTATISGLRVAVAECFEKF